MIELKKDTKILFIGDSITSCGRNLYMELGFGFPNMVMAQLAADNPEKNLMGISKGIGRNRTCDMLRRWESDCLDQNPDIVVILIGINDAITGYFPGCEPVNPQDAKKNMQIMLEKIKDKKIIILEPFITINEGKFANPWGINESWVKSTQAIRKIIKEVSEEFNTEFIPLNAIFNDLAEKYGPNKWTCEGVHPTTAGHGVITKEILKLIKY